MSISRRDALLGATAAVAVAGVPVAAKAAGVQAALGGEEEAKAKKRAVLIKELRELALSMESKLDALQERLARGLPS